MKKTLRKIIPFMLLAATSLTTGCSMYSSKADTLENIVGFYELEIWSGKHEATDEETYDRKAEEGTVAYFTIDKNGYAYYGFKDNETEAWVKPAFAHYTADDDNPELYKAVTIEGKVDTVYAWEKHVGCMDESPMGFKREEVKKGNGPFAKKEMVSTLSYTIPWHEYTWYNPHKIQKYQYVQYRRISDATGYAVINEKLGTNYQQKLPYELEGMQGRLVYRCQYKDGQTGSQKGLYEYAVIDLDTYANGKVKLYYSLATNPGQQIIDVDLSINEAGRSMKGTIFGRTFYSNGVGFETKFNEEYTEEETINWESFSHSSYTFEASLDEVIAGEKALD